MKKEISFQNNNFQVLEDDIPIATVKYNLEIPENMELCDISNYAIYELYNYYFCNSNDIYKVHIESKEDTVGYVFPIQVLDEKNEKLDKWQKICLYTAAQWILNNKHFDGEKSFLNIYNLDDKELMKQNVSIPVIMIINKTCVPEFDIESYKLSLLLNGYSFYRDQELKNIKRENFFFESQTKLKLIKCKTPLEPELSNILFSELLNTDNVAYKFLIIYQCFEFLMKLEQQKRNEKIKNEFPTIDLMDFKTLREFKKNIQEFDNEKSLLKSVFNDVEILEEFKNDVSYFSSVCQEVLSFTDSDDIYLKIYNVRNCLFHFYRNFFNNSKFDQLLFLSYQMLIELLISKLSKE